MSSEARVGWGRLFEGYPWFSGEGRYPIDAYSEFMPPPRLGRRAYGETDASLFVEDDPFGWHVSEVEEEYELKPGLASLAAQIVAEVVELGRGGPARRIAGHQGLNLAGNPYWPPELASQSGRLPHERYVVFLPLALSKTQDDKGRQRWTFFGGSEQGPEQAFWKSFYRSPNHEPSSGDALSFLPRLISAGFGQRCNDLSDLRRVGFRILPTQRNPRFPYWPAAELPSWTRPFLWGEDMTLEGVHYLLTFRPFSLLPASVRERYLRGELALLPFPGSLAFWGMPGYARLQGELPVAMQLPLQHLASRHAGPDAIRVPQSGWFHEAGSDFRSPEIQEYLLLNSYKRTSRWDRVHRHDDEVMRSTIEDRMGRTLFGTELEVMGLYGKPMARNSQIWTTDFHLLLDGPNASRDDLDRAARAVARGGTFGYRFQFPAMRVGRYEVYWQRPLAAYWHAQQGRVEVIPGALLGYMTAYPCDKPDLAGPPELWPRLRRREPYLWALRNYERVEEHYRHQTALNAIRLLDTRRRWGKPLPRTLARQVLRLSERETLESWLAPLPEKASDHGEGEKLRQELENCLEPLKGPQSWALSSAGPHLAALPKAVTFEYTANRDFERAWWNDIRSLSTGEYVNKNNADCVRDAATQTALSHRHRDLETLGDHLLSRHRQAIVSSDMEGKTVCGEFHFRWKTDFEFSSFGGWENNQERHTHERNLVVVIPGKDRSEAVIMADHYDTAYMEDVYDKARGGSGARLASAGADDNHSATATLLQATPVFLRLSREGKLQRDVWLVHLTGEEFPSDCLGARHLCQALVEGTLNVRTGGSRVTDLSHVRVSGVFLMDMVGHNRDSERDVFQISPGRGRKSLALAWQAHLANVLWNIGADEWNKADVRRGAGRGRRSTDGTVPGIAEHLRLRGEVRLSEDPHSSLFNTDGQIFSDCGIPVVLFMENYDISRDGYHDTKDTMMNIDLDYGAALAATAIEAVAQEASARPE